MAITTRRSRYRGCLLGGAVGDALGAPVEFLQLGEIRARYGPEGIAEFDEAYGVVGAITDDTQMTMFTAEGLLRAHVRQQTKGICNPPGVVHHAYLRWLHTQGERSEHPMFNPEEFDGWLIEEERLFERRAPGDTCISSLLGDRENSVDGVRNDSKGCGGVMRAAPVGLLVVPEFAFEFGCDVARLTHGHPSGYFAAGALAVIVSTVLGEKPDVLTGHEHAGRLEHATQQAKRTLIAHDDEEVLRALGNATISLREGPATAEGVEQLGQGWVADEALAIAIYCALGAVTAEPDDHEAAFELGIRLAVNHSGDSGSTGAITGNLLGTLLGEEAIPARWREEVELADVVLAVADDLYAASEGEKTSWERYPGW